MRQTRQSDLLPGLEAVAPPARLRLSPSQFLTLARRGEGALIAACLLGAWLWAGMPHWPVWQGGSWVLAGAALVWGWARLTRPRPSQILGAYDQPGQALRHARRLWLITLPLTLGPVHAALGPEAARIAATGLLPAALLSLLWRAALSSRVRRLIRQGRLGLRVVVAGGGREARETLMELAKLRRQGVQVLGIFDDREPARSPLVQQGVAKLGRIRDMPAFLRRTPFDLVIVTMPPSAEARIGQILSDLWAMPVDIRLAPVRSTLIYRPRTYRWLGGVALLDLFDRPLRAADAALKRSFDLCLAALILMLLAPLFGLIALAIRLDSPGPVFFRQAREGYASRPFHVWKFRSLHHAQSDPGAVVPVTAGDSRVTRLGRILRKSSLDELPQLFNVIEGSMSLVGPRPHALGARNREMEFAAVVRSYAARHRVKPGITGLAQVQGLRGPVQTPDQISRRVALDLEYIDRWSLMLDLRILALTLPSVLRGENAV
jgi:Undecaprenyl-phosphate glucose phosphotransferase